MEDYTFTEDDLWAYLATKQDDEVIGVCRDSTACLIAEAMRAKYPQFSHASRPSRGVDVSIGGAQAVMTLWGVDMETQCLFLSPVLCDVVRAFDFYGVPKRRYESVTKREFMQAWQAFLAENGLVSVFEQQQKEREVGRCPHNRDIMLCPECSPWA